MGHSLKKAMNVEKLSRGVWSHHPEPKRFICGNCGLDKSKSVEDLGSCVCGAGAAMDNSLSIELHADLFRSGGNPVKRSRYLENGIKKIEESQLSNSDKVKVMLQAPDLDSTQEKSGKSEAAVHMRRLNDTPAVVPIKKRRIQVRSSSPPPRSPSPQTPLPRSSSPRVVSCAGSPLSGQSPSAALVSSQHSDSTVLSPRSVVQLPMSEFNPEVLLQPALQPSVPAAREIDGANTSLCGNVVAVEAQDQSLFTSSAAGHIEMSSKGEREQPASSTGEKTFKEECATTAQSVAEGVLEVMAEPNLQDSSWDPNHVSNKQEGEGLISESSSFSRDDRLRWDLNTEMAAWDASTEQASDKVCNDDEAAEMPHRSPSGHSAETNQDHWSAGHDTATEKQGEEDQESREQEEPEKEELVLQKGDIDEEQDLMEDEVSEVEPETVDENMEDPGMQEAIQEEEPEEEVQNTTEHLEQREIDSTEREGMPSLKPVESESNVELPNAGNPRTWGPGLPCDDGYDEEPSEVQFQEGEIPAGRQSSKSGKQSKSTSDDAEGWNYASEEPELEEHVDYGDSDFRDADDVGLDIDDRASLVQEENNWKMDDGLGNSGSFKWVSQEGDLSNVDEAVNDQLLERGPERHAPSGRSRATGWDQLPEGFDNAEEALRAAKDVSAWRGGRGGSWSSSVGRGSSLGSHTANRFGPGSARSNVRDEFLGARGDGYHGDRRPDEMVYDRDGYRHGRRPEDDFSTPARGGDSLRRPGVFGRGRGGGWIDSRPGHMNRLGPSRQRPSSGFSGPSNAAARAENSGFFVDSDGTLTKAGGGMGPGRGPMRSTVIGGRGGRGRHAQIGRGPSSDMDGGIRYPLRAGDRLSGMGAGGRGSGGSSGPRYGSGMHDRGGRGVTDRFRGRGMDSRRSESPHRQRPLDHHPNMIGRMPGMRPDSRVVRSRTPPVRSQRSPPPSSRWSNDKREVDYPDRDFKRPLSRPRVVPSQRTSPHVIHGSSLTDDRDRQVLAGGSRQSLPVKDPVSASMNYSMRKSRDDRFEMRGPRRSEDEDVIRHPGPFVKDREYRSSPLRPSDRERERSGLYRRDWEGEEDRRHDFQRSSSRDGRFSSGPKFVNTREADDDVAPRRRRPS